MIYNRTAEDVAEAKRIKAEKVQKFVQLTDNDVNILERGFLTINTVSRIENKQSEIKSLFAQMGYYNTPIINKTWDSTQIFTEEDIKRIVRNADILKNAFFVFADTPSTPTAKYYYENINALEKILYDLDAMTNEIKILYRECGGTECGG